MLHSGDNRFLIEPGLERILPKRQRKKKSAPSDDAADQGTPQQPQTNEGLPDTDDSSSAPKKKAPRQRRKKKPAVASPADQKKPERARPAPTSDTRRKKREAPPRKSRTGGALESPPPPAAGPARGRRTGLGASGKPRKGRSSASLVPPASTPPSGSRKPTRPKPTPSARTERPASNEARPKRKDPAAEARSDTDQAATPPSKDQKDKRPEPKKPVSKTRQTSAKAEPVEREKKPTPAEPRRDRAKQAKEKESPPRSKKKPAPAKPRRDQAEQAEKKPAPAGPQRDQAKQAEQKETVARGEKKPRERKRKPAESPPVEPRPESAPVEIAPAETEKAAEVLHVEPKPKPKKKPHDTEPRRKRERGHAPPFGDLALSDDMLKALADAGYQEPTPVQAGLIPKALGGHDLMGQARTGTGKTAAFGIPLLEKFASGEKRKEPAALILVPTRELAVQVRDEIAKLAGRSRVTTVAVYGGKPIRGQIEHLRRGAEIVVGTPGRVIDLIDRRALILGSLECVVLDEADRMLDIGFRPDIEKILRRCPQSRQTLLLSATIPPPVKRLAERYMHEPEMLDFSPQDVAVETIEQFYFTVDPRQKFDLLVKLIEREDPKQAIIFCRTRKGTDRVGTRLGRKFKGAAMIHGDLQQRQRDRVMADFRAGKVRFLAATDVVGRGIDVTGISHIINFDIPQFCDDYIHRVGRTGRMGREGVAYTFVSPEEGNELTRIEIRINRLLIRDEMPGFLAVPRPEATEIPDTPEGEPPKPKPVFGKRTRRNRRAL